MSQKDNIPSKVPGVPTVSASSTAAAAGPKQIVDVLDAPFVPGDSQFALQAPRGATGQYDEAKAVAAPKPGEAAGGDAPQAKAANSGDGELKGAELDAALEQRGLPKTGTADERRAAVEQYDRENA